MDQSTRGAEAPRSPRQNAAPETGFPARQVRSLFVSDLHLGSGSARARDFLQFLRRTEAEMIYLVGDIFDVWHVGRIEWTPSHDAILAELGRRAARGTRVVYLPGNHDAVMRNFVPIGGPLLTAGMFELADQITHVAADGRRYLVLHGDQCDARILKWHGVTRLGSWMDAALRRLELGVMRRLGRGQTDAGLMDLLRQTINALVLVGNGFETRLIDLARAGGHDGVICGHYHRAALRDHAGTAYVNCGDWVDSLTAVAEHPDGRLEVLEWQPAPAVARSARPALQEGLA
ncbi:MAG: UDP-2,3-diacylglucosamine diphosphatase [Qingshengfaniella sp.]